MKAKKKVRPITRSAVQAQPQREAQSEPQPPEARERVLREFSERATRSGIRSVIMSELASELRMSPNTLYQHFRSKKDLVTALVERWAEEVGASQAAVVELASTRSAVERMTRWAEAWAQSVARYSPPRFSEQLSTTRGESIRTAIGIWARGALKNQGKLTILPRR